jgi:peptide/nickel transport system substrate-binding protein
VKQPAFDPAKAKALLAEAGWKPGADGIMAKDGKKLTLTIGTHSEDPNRVQSVEFIQNVLKQNGVDAKVAISDWPSFSGGVQNGKHEIGLMGWVALVDPDRLMYGQLHSTGGLNWGKYSNAKVDEALTAGRAATSLPARAAAYKDAAAVLAEELPYYVLSYQGFHVFTDKALTGFVPDPRGYLRSLAAK